MALTIRQRLFVERSLSGSYSNRTDAYQSVYQCECKRRSITALAARCWKRPEVQKYARLIVDRRVELVAQAGLRAEQARLRRMC